MTTSAMTPEALGASVINELLKGGSPNGVLAVECGVLGGAVDQCYVAHATGGTPAVIKLFNSLLRSDKQLAAVMGGHNTTLVRKGVPELPKDATVIYQHLEPCGFWLDEYVTFARQAAPMTPVSFHEAAGLAAVSAAVARRLVLPAGTKRIYPNLFFLLIAPSTLHRKSSGMEVMQQVLDAAGLSQLLLPQHASPEALSQELGTAVPGTLGQWDVVAKEEWISSRAFAAQRLWMLDEVSGLFDNMRREVYAGLLNLLLRMYECPERIVEQTISRGRQVIQHSYLTFLGASTPSSMAAHLSNPRYWTDGLWARFVILAPDVRPEWKFFEESLPVPVSVTGGLNQIMRLFPMPKAELVEVGDGGKGQAISVHGAGSMEIAYHEPGVWPAWEAYAKATGYTIVSSGDIDPSLYGNYGRMGTLLMKVALLFAAMDSHSLPVTVGLRHLARAQQLVERWRHGLHKVWTEGIEVDETRTEDRILGLLAKAGPLGLVARDIYRPLHLTGKGVRELLEEMQRSGQVESAKRTTNGRSIDVWRLVSGANP